MDDSIYETSEFLLLRLAEPVGCRAITGDLDVTVVTLQDPEDGKSSLFNILLVKLLLY